MKFRLITSLLLIAVLTGLYLWAVQPEERPAAPASPSPAVDPAGSSGLGRLRIF